LDNITTPPLDNASPSVEVDDLLAGIGARAAADAVLGATMQQVAADAIREDMRRRWQESAIDLIGLPRPLLSDSVLRGIGAITPAPSYLVSLSEVTERIVETAAWIDSLTGISSCMQALEAKLAGMRPINEMYDAIAGRAGAWKDARDTLILPSLAIIGARALPVLPVLPTPTLQPFPPFKRWSDELAWEPPAQDRAPSPTLARVLSFVRNWIESKHAQSRRLARLREYRYRAVPRGCMIELRAMPADGPSVTVAYLVDAPPGVAGGDRPAAPLTIHLANDDGGDGLALQRAIDDCRPALRELATILEQGFGAQSFVEAAGGGVGVVAPTPPPWERIPAGPLRDRRALVFRRTLEGKSEREIAAELAGDKSAAAADREMKTVKNDKTWLRERGFLGD